MLHNITLCYDVAPKWTKTVERHRQTVDDVFIVTELWLQNCSCLHYYLYQWCRTIPYPILGPISHTGLWIPFKNRYESSSKNIREQELEPECLKLGLNTAVKDLFNWVFYRMWDTVWVSSSRGDIAALVKVICGQYVVISRGSAIINTADKVNHAEHLIYNRHL